MTDPDTSDGRENALERLLRIATSEPGRRPEFYRRLLDSDVYVITTKRRPGQNIVPANSDLAIVQFEFTDGTWVVPFFSSLAMARHGAPGEEAAVIMRARELFEAFPQRILVLNLNCPFGRQFYPDEVERLLATGSLDETENEILDKAKLVVFETVTAPPAESISALITLFSRTPGITAAYLVRCLDPGHVKRATLVIALVAQGNMDAVMRESAGVIRDTYRGTDVVDMIVMPDRDEQIWTNIRAIGTRFYDRSWGERISEAFGGALH